MSRAVQTAQKFVQYHQRVLATDPIVYWVQNEKSGTVAYDLVSGRVAGAQNGTHVGVTLGQPGIGDGNTCPLYDGANDYANVHTPAFAGVFSGAEGTVMIWAKVANAGVWTDGTARSLIYLQADGNNYVRIRKSNANNLLEFWYKAGGTFDSVAPAYSATIWTPIAITWDINAGGTGEMRAFLNGSQVGATQVGLGVWVGALNGVSTVIGAGTTVPDLVYDGYLAHCAVWDRALAPAAIADLAVV